MNNPRLSPVYLVKLDLDDDFMWLWFRLKDNLSVALLIPMKKSTDEQLLVFHIFLPMGYVDSVPYLYMSTKTITDIENSSMEGRHMAPPHPLKGLYAISAL